MTIAPKIRVRHGSHGRRASGLEKAVAALPKVKQPKTKAEPRTWVVIDETGPPLPDRPPDFICTRGGPYDEPDEDPPPDDEPER